MRRLALGRLGHETIPVDYLLYVRRHHPLWRKAQWHLRAGPMVLGFNNALRRRLAQRPDMLWVDKGLFVSPGLVREAKQAGVRYAVHYSPDNYFLAQNSSRHFWRALPLYDLVVTTKTHNVEELKRQGARRVLLSGNAYDPATHRPVELSEAERRQYGCDVSFVGRWELHREQWLERVAALGVRLSIRGTDWQRAKAPAVRNACSMAPALGDEYARAVSGAKINLALLSRLAGDQVTQRSVEIPACGGFMLAERTDEHLAHFTEGVEAAYFSGLEELCAQVDYYLAHETERRRIASAGRARCISCGYAYDDRLREILSVLTATH